ncbi:MAG: hypothetical protein M3N08_00630 [Pseudomonadota bacterium]|nr:hypothetical protein [Pseudomonadota bacterium]
MSTINFGVAVPQGALTGNVDGINAYVSSYIATDVSGGYQLPNTTIFCISPDQIASTAVSSYTVLQGVTNPNFSTQQISALEGIFSHYIDAGDTSANAQAITMVADWKIVNPKLVVSNISQNVLNAADVLANQALASQLTIDPTLKFTTLQSQGGCSQDFVNISQVPLPASLGMFVCAIALLGLYAARKKLAAV